MKTMKKSIILVVSIATLLISTIPILAATATVTDGTGDVHHWVVNNGVGSWETATVTKPNIDIIEVSLITNTTNVTLTLKVSGVIEDSQNIKYMINYSSSDTTYKVWYWNGSGGGIGTKLIGLVVTSGKVTKSGNTVSAVFTLIGDSSNVELFGSAFQYTEYNNLMKEYWVDYAPDSYFHNNTSGPTGDITPPSKVTGLVVTDAHNGKLNLSWSAATDNVAVNRYRIYRDGAFADNTTSTSFQDIGRTNGVTYSYVVSAVDKAGNEGLKSDPVQGTPTPSGGGGTTDTQVPTQVTGLIVDDAHDGKLNLSWNVATDNVAVGHYKIYRDNVFIHNSSTTSYQDTELTNDQAYVYQVSAVDTSGNEGDRSDHISGTPTASSVIPEPKPKTPGFEIVVLAAALVITITLLRRKK